MKLPTLSDIYNEDIQEGYKDQNLNLLLNADPKPSWVKSRIINGKEFKYLPIDKVEFLLRKLFGQFRIKVLSVSEIHGGVQVTVRVYYLLPPNEDKERTWAFQDGVGAVTLSSQYELEPAVPLAKTFAIKDACDHIGNIFGANLNRLDVITYNKDENIDKIAEMEYQLKNLFMVYQEHLKPIDVTHIERIIKNKEVLSYKKVIDILVKIKEGKK
jgi:hypothetical protein